LHGFGIKWQMYGYFYGTNFEIGAKQQKLFP